MTDSSDITAIPSGEATPNAPSAPARLAPTVVPARTAAPPRPSPTPTLANPRQLRIGMTQEPESLTLFPGSLYGTLVVQNLLFRLLVALDDKLQPYGDLCESVPTLENGGAKWIGDGPNRQLQTIFRLRDGLKWSDGQPITASDVKFTFELVLNPNALVEKSLERKYEKVETPDPRTVVMTMFSESSARASYSRSPEDHPEFKDQTGPVANPRYYLGISASWIYPLHVVSPLVQERPSSSTQIMNLFNRSSFEQTPITSGPYTVRTWRKGQSLELVARKDYPGGGPKLETISFSFEPRVETLIESLAAGRLEMVTGEAIDIATLPLLKSVPGIRTELTKSTVLEHIDFNLDHPALKEREVRLAIGSAIDREELIRDALSGHSEPLSGLILPELIESPATDQSKIVYSPEKATALLQSAGWIPGPDGIRAKGERRLRLKLSTTDYPPRLKAAELIKRRLRQVGIELEVETLSPRLLLSPQSGRLARREFDLALYSWVASAEPSADLDYFFTSKSVPDGANGYRGGNYPGFRNAEVDRAIGQSLRTAERAERGRLLREAERMVMSELPTVPLYYIPKVSLVSNRLFGVRPAIGPIGETWNAAEWELR